MIAGKARWLGLGRESIVTLAQARRLAAKARETIANGGDPLSQKQDIHAERKATASAKTFDEVAGELLESQEVGWRNVKHRAQWHSTLKQYVSPVLGSKKINGITTEDVIAAIKPIWTAKPETAGRVRGRIERVIGYATAHGWRTGDNPARWRGHLSEILPAQSSIAKVKHHPALPWVDVPAFMARLQAEEGIAAQALSFLIHTSARTGEVIGARWEEIDLAAKTWTIPSGRMKAAKEHRVPLSEAAIAILLLRVAEVERSWAAGSHENGNGTFVFPASKKDKHISNMVFLMLLRRMERANITTHGFRSSFREWAAEATNHPREIAEAALAHGNKDKVELAYMRGDHFAKRRQLMNEWARHCAGQTWTDAE